MRTLLVVLPYEVVHEKRLAAARRTQHELVAVGRDAPLHRQVGDVKVQRFSSEPVHHLDAEGRERAAVVGFLREEAYRLLDEGVETLFLSLIHISDCKQAQADNKCYSCSHVTLDFSGYRYCPLIGLSLIHISVIQSAAIPGCNAVRNAPFRQIRCV